MAAAGSQPISPVSRAGFAVSLLSARTGLRLSDQADLRAVDLVQQAIAALPPGAVKTHRQLASLEYIDVAATRELDMLVARPPMRRLALHYPRRSCSDSSSGAGPRPRRGWTSALPGESTWAEGARPGGLASREDAAAAGAGGPVRGDRS